MCIRDRVYGPRKARLEYLEAWHHAEAHGAAGRRGALVERSFSRLPRLVLAVLRAHVAGTCTCAFCTLKIGAPADPHF